MSSERLYDNAMRLHAKRAALSRRVPATCTFAPTVTAKARKPGVATGQERFEHLYRNAAATQKKIAFEREKVRVSSCCREVTGVVAPTCGYVAVPSTVFNLSTKHPAAQPVRGARQPHSVHSCSRGNRSPVRAREAPGRSETGGCCEGSARCDGAGVPLCPLSPTARCRVPCVSAPHTGARGAATGTGPAGPVSVANAGAGAAHAPVLLRKHEDETGDAAPGEGGRGTRAVHVPAPHQRTQCVRAAQSQVRRPCFCLCVFVCVCDSGCNRVCPCKPHLGNAPPPL